MSRALVTLATGDHQRLLDIARPSFQAFADRHGYELVEPELESDRPPSWWKVPALLAALDEFEEALWVDADVVITDTCDDLDVPSGMWQALVEHHTGDGNVPNCGVWYVRQPMKEWLPKVWARTHFVRPDCWWEQAALMEEMGYRVDPRPSLLFRQSVLYEKTHWLDQGFNVHKWSTPGTNHPRFMHASMHEDREKVMREWASGDVPPVPDTQCRHLYEIRGCPFCTHSTSSVATG